MASERKVTSSYIMVRVVVRIFGISHCQVPRKAFVADERGATLIEAALIVPLMVLILICCFEALRMSYFAVSIQFVVERALRNYVVAPMAPAALRDEVIAQSRLIGLSIAPSQITLCRLENAGCGTIEATERGQFVVLNVRLTPLFSTWAPGQMGVLMRNIALDATVVGRNEP